MTKRMFIHSSGRFDRTQKSLDDSIKALRKQGVLITHTELSNHNIVKDPNWVALRLPGAGHSEYVIQYDKRVLKKTGPIEAHRLSEMRYRAYGGRLRYYFYAVSVPFEDIETGDKFVVLDTHMPLDNTKKRAQVWISCAKGMVRVTREQRSQYPGHKIHWQGDWNKNFREARERAMISDYICAPAKLHQSWYGHEKDDKGGSHGRRQLIDGALTDVDVYDCDLLRDDNSSDHRPVGITVELGELIPVERPPLPKPKPKPVRRWPQPGTSGVNWKKYKSPIDHPWTARSRRWQRRHPIMYRRILRWRRWYREQLKKQ